MDGLTKEEILNKENEEVLSYDKIDYLIYDWILYNNKRIPKIKTKKFVKDSIGTIKVRLGINRLNYKLTFDLLRNASENLAFALIFLYLL